MLTRHVALVSEESSIDMSELSAVAAALQKQVTRDFSPLWRIDADVAAYASLEQVPLDYWPVVIMDDIGDPSAAGYHEDQHGQPFALVQYSDGWTLTASHETLEMLGDPFGRRLVAGQSPKAGQGRVRFLVEVCDPSEAEEYAYSINGISVSDFYTPHFFDPVTASGVRYSYTGAITEPRQVLRGGYLSWYDPATRSWYQRTWFGSEPQDKQLKALKIENGNIRAALDRLTEGDRARAMKRTGKKATRAGLTAMPGKQDAAFAGNAADLRAQIAQIKKTKG